MTPQERSPDPSPVDGTGGALARAGAALLRVRWFVRAPILLYRARMGAVFGGRLLMLEHSGRRTGKRRYVVLEVIDRPRPGAYVVVWRDPGTAGPGALSRSVTLKVVPARRGRGRRRAPPQPDPSA